MLSYYSQYGKMYWSFHWKKKNHHVKKLEPGMCFFVINGLFKYTVCVGMNVCMLCVWPCSWAKRILMEDPSTPLIVICEWDVRRLSHCGQRLRLRHNLWETSQEIVPFFLLLKLTLFYSLKYVVHRSDGRKMNVLFKAEVPMAVLPCCKNSRTWPSFKRNG